MAYTVEIIATPASGNVLATARTGATGTANVAGYAITLVAGNLHTITIAEALLGPWVLTAGDGLSQRVLTFETGRDEYLLGVDTDRVLDAVEAIAASDPVFVQSAITDPTIVELVANDTYDGVGKPKLTWTVSKDYTDAWDVVFTIRDKDDVVVATAAGVVASTTLIEVTITGPSAGLTFEGCPSVWQGRFDLELSKGSSVETIALGDVYVYRDVTR